jgi:hypothetical protein
MREFLLDSGYWTLLWRAGLFLFVCALAIALGLQPLCNRSRRQQ